METVQTVEEADLDDLVGPDSDFKVLKYFKTNSVVFIKEVTLTKSSFFLPPAGAKTVIRTATFPWSQYCMAVKRTGHRIAETNSSTP